MNRSRPDAAPLEGAVRSRLILWLAVLVVGLSVLAMHQMSGNHTAADPAFSHQPATVTADGSNHHDAGHSLEAAGADQGHPLLMPGEEHPVSGEGGCPGCAGHPAMALTCLAALLLLAAGFLLPRRRAGRGNLQPRLEPLAILKNQIRFKPPPLSLVELSVSRT